MKKTIRILAFIMAFSMFFVLAACGEYKIKDVDTITVSGPSPDDEKGVSTILSSTMHSTDFYEIIDICQGEEFENLDGLETHPTFGGAKMLFTQTTGNTITIYPACDGTPYLQIGSLNPDQSTYLKIGDTSMKRLAAILKKHNIDIL